MPNIKLEIIKLNQTIVHDNETSTLFSYTTPIASKTPYGIILHPQWMYSPTTSKYRSQFLGEDTKTTKARLMSGEYRLKDYYAKD